MKKSGNGWRITNRHNTDIIKIRILGILMLVLTIYAKIDRWFYDEILKVEDGTYLLICVPLALVAIFGKSEWFGDDEYWED